MITLTWPELVLAANAGVMRRISAVKAGRFARYGATDAGAWDHDVNGALAEMAVAKWAGVFWSGTVGQVDAADVGRLQVRSKVDPGHRLVIRPTDIDDEVFISVLVSIPQCKLCGWLTAREAKRDEWLVSVNRPPMYFVTDQFLRPMEALKAL